MRVWAPYQVVVFLALALSLQWLGGAYRAEFCGHPDEPAHYVTGLMVHDYLQTWPPASPFAFARNFYLHYPKIALGHWPPFFYALQAAWTLPFGTSRTSVLALMAVLAALLAATLGRVVAAECGTVAGWLAGATLLLLPAIQEFAGMVMTEIPVALLCLWAMLSWARYMENGRRRDALWFGAWASAAVMTKGSGLALALAAPLALILGRRLDLLRRRETWLAGSIVALVCGPWYVLTFRMQSDGWVETAGTGFFARASVYNLGEMARLVGPVGAAMALVGLAVKMRRLEPKWAALAALVAAVFVFQSLVPASLDIRHLITAAAPLVAFAVAAVAWMPKRAVVAAALGVAFVVTTFAIPVKRGRGMAGLVTDVLARPELRHSVILICSQGDGEGIIISEVAMRERRPGHVLLRGTKVLSDAEWNGTHYRARFADAGAVEQYLESVPVALLVVDSTPGERDHLHYHQVEQMIARYPDRWQLVGRYGRNVRMYQLLGAGPHPTHLDLKVGGTAGEMFRSPL